MTTSTPSKSNLVEAVLAAEKRRCDALVGHNIDELRKLIRNDLSHIHATGKFDDYDSYFAFAETSHFIACERGNLDVRVYGNTAVMVGAQTISVRIPEKEEPISIEVTVTQVWVLNDANEWQQTAFQATRTTQ